MSGSEKYGINNDFIESFHGSIGCINCHGGQNDTDKDKAHIGLVADPSAIEGGVCADCHSGVAETFKTSLHYTSKGQGLGLEALTREGAIYGHIPDDHVAEIFQGDCYGCHATCGQCHISLPNTLNGGLLDGHNIVKSPSAEGTCYNCHGARSAGEYIGNVNGIPTMADTHWKNAKMECVDCHSLSNFHGTGAVETEKFQLAELPKCVDCHPNALPGKDDIPAHNAHPEDTLQCQVCHSVAYNNCWDCHFTLNDQGNYGSKSTAKLAFKIGLNPDRDELHPWKYILVRHVPTAENTLGHLGDNLLPNFDNVPNWKMTAAHNIQRKTPQNNSCNKCHGNSRLFLTEKDLTATDPAANMDLVVKEIPAKL